MLKMPLALKIIGRGIPSKTKQLKRLLAQVNQLEVVPDGFDYVEGLKVGIVAWNPKDGAAKRNFSHVGMDDVDDSKQVFGNKEAVMIYVGKL